MVTVKTDISGNPSNTFPENLAVVSPILSIGGGYDIIFLRKKKYLILSIIDLLMLVIRLIFNK